MPATLPRPLARPYGHSTRVRPPGRDQAFLCHHARAAPVGSGWKSSRQSWILKHKRSDGPDGPPARTGGRDEGDPAPLTAARIGRNRVGAARQLAIPVIAEWVPFGRTQLGKTGPPLLPARAASARSPTGAKPCKNSCRLPNSCPGRVLRPEGLLRTGVDTTRNGTLHQGVPGPAAHHLCTVGALVPRQYAGLLPWMPCPACAPRAGAAKHGPSG